MGRNFGFGDSVGGLKIPSRFLFPPEKGVPTLTLGMAAEEATCSDSDAGVAIESLEHTIAAISLDARLAEDSDDTDDEREPNESSPDEILSLPLLVAKNLPPDFAQDDDEDGEGLLAAVATLEHVRLDRCELTHLGDVDNGPGNQGPRTVITTPLSFAKNITSLYLQRNRLRSLNRAVTETATPNLRFLSINSNLLEDETGTTHHPLFGLETLPNLLFLDAGGNEKLRKVSPLLQCLPSSLCFLNMEGTFVATTQDYRAACIASLDSLKRLDEVDITKGEKRAALLEFGEGSGSGGSTDEDDDEFDDEEDDAKGPCTSTSATYHSAAYAAASVLGRLTPGNLPVDQATFDSEMSLVKNKLESVSGGGILKTEMSSFSTVFRAGETDRAANRAAERVEESRDQFVDMDAKVRHAQKTQAIQGGVGREGGEKSVDTIRD